MFDPFTDLPQFALPPRSEPFVTQPLRAPEQPVPTSRGMNPILATGAQPSVLQQPPVRQLEGKAYSIKDSTYNKCHQQIMQIQQVSPFESGDLQNLASAEVLGRFIQVYFARFDLSVFNLNLALFE